MPRKLMLSCDCFRTVIRAGVPPLVFLLLTIVQPQVCVAFNYKEHKSIGEEAFRQFLYTSGDSSKINFFRQYLGWARKNPRLQSIEIFPAELSSTYHKEITYGDLNALSADHSINPFEEFTGLLSGQSITEAIVQAQTRGSNDFELELIDPRYAIIAILDKSHFYKFGLATFRDQLLEANYGLLDTLRKDFFGHFEEVFLDLRRTNAIAKYAILHCLALECAGDAGSIPGFLPRDITQRAFLFKLAILFNAFADHFLQDSFSAGHLMVDRSYWAFLDDKGKHDYYCRVGLDVQNENGDHWKTYGDGYLDSMTRTHAVSACKASLGDVWAEYDSVFNGSNPFAAQLMGAGNDNPRIVDVIMSRLHSILGLMPIPLRESDLAEHARFGNSRNGLLVGLSLGCATGGSMSKNMGPTIGAVIGMGYDARSDTSSADKGTESLLWLGLEYHLAYGNRKNGTQMEQLWGVEAVVNDAWLFSVSLGPGLRTNEGLSLAPGVGYEYKPVWSGFGLAFEVVPRFSKGTPEFEGKMEFRWY